MQCGGYKWDWLKVGKLFRKYLRIRIIFRLLINNIINFANKIKELFNF